MALFVAKHLGAGVTEYRSRRTGRLYRLGPEPNSDAFYVEAGIDLLIGHSRKRLLENIEQLDAREGNCVHA